MTGNRGSGVQPEWIEVIVGWAAATPLVRAVYIFGSRAKGTHRSDSDLDIAVDVDGVDEQERFANSICCAEEWREQLSALLPISLHLQTMSEDDTIVTPAVLDHGIRIYAATAA